MKKEKRTRKALLVIDMLRDFLELMGLFSVERRPAGLFLSWPGKLIISINQESQLFLSAILIDAMTLNLIFLNLIVLKEQKELR